MGRKLRLGILEAIVGCLLVVVCMSASAATLSVIASGDWDDPATWMDGIGPNPAGGDVAALHAGSFDSYITSAYLIAGTYGPGWTGIDSSVTIKNGGSLTCDGTVGWVQGVGPTNVGKLIIEGGGSFSMTGGYAMFVARSYGDPAGTGMIIVKDSGSFSCTTAMLYLGLSELEGASDTQHGVFQVIGGGGSINAPQFRAFRGAEVIAFPKANGPSGLTTIECEYLIHKTTDATADTNTTLTVAPHY